LTHGARNGFDRQVDFLVTVPFFAIFLFWGAQLTHLFGPSFAVSQAVDQWLAVVPRLHDFLAFRHGPVDDGKHVIS